MLSFQFKHSSLEIHMTSMGKVNNIEAGPSRLESWRYLTTSRFGEAKSLSAEQNEAWRPSSNKQILILCTHLNFNNPAKRNLAHLQAVWASYVGSKVFLHFMSRWHSRGFEALALHRPAPGAGPMQTCQHEHRILSGYCRNSWFPHYYAALYIPQKLHFITF